MYSFQNNNKKVYKETEKYGTHKGKNKSIETIPEKDQIAYLLDTQFIIFLIYYGDIG